MATHSKEYWWMIDYSEDEDVFQSRYLKFEQLLKDSRYPAVLTGAGVSTLSGIPDFRGTGGVYTQQFNHLDVEEIIEINFFHRHPEIFYQWAADVWYKLEDYEPNIVHKALAEMEACGKLHEVFTQNIDLLHQKAGSREVYELHGSPMHNYCTRCHAHYSYEQVSPTAREGKVPYCSCGGVIKPDIVFYGEGLDSHTWQKADEVFGRRCDLCIVLGSSLNVSPVNQLPYLAYRHGCPLIIVNAQETPLNGFARHVFRDLRQFSQALLTTLGKERK